MSLKKSTDIFTRPENPFLLIYDDPFGNTYRKWLVSEEELQEVVKEVRCEGGYIVEAIEIGSYRNVEIGSEYTIDDFVDEINSAYETAKDQGFDDIVLVVVCETGEEYCIYDTEYGFGYGTCDCYYDDLDSIAAELYHKEVNRKPVEIRIE